MLVSTGNGLLIDVMENRDGGDDLRRAASAALLVARYDEPDTIGHGTLKIRPEDILVQDDDDDDLGAHVLGRDQLLLSSKSSALGFKDTLFGSDNILSKMSDFGRRPVTPTGQLMTISTSPRITGTLQVQFDQLVASDERGSTTFELKTPDLTMPSPISPERSSKPKTHLGTPPTQTFGQGSSPFSYQLDKLHPSPMGSFDTHEGYHMAALSPPLGSGISYLMGGKSVPSSPNGGLDQTLRAYNTPMSPDLSFPPASAEVISEELTKPTSSPSAKRRNNRLSDVPGVSVIKPDVQQLGPLPIGAFKCDHPGCKARPFQTQYLLNSHQNVHSTSRPHLCPVAGCKRSQLGQGFKRKNEMIRHSLVHSSPGYVCPFCPDREHRYPRPDNLQRHVRVHHQDKDRDDPLLRNVLSLRPQGETKNRRKRTVPATLNMPRMEPNHDKLARGVSV